MTLSPESCNLIESDLHALELEAAQLHLGIRGIEQTDRALARISHLSHSIRSEIAYNAVHTSSRRRDAAPHQPRRTNSIDELD